MSEAVEQQQQQQHQQQQQQQLQQHKLHNFVEGPWLGGSEGAIAPIDLWRVHLAQCPECGFVHTGGVPGNGRRPERHIYEYTRGAAQDLLCPLCGEVYQAPVQAPCGHHYCSICVRTLLTRTAGRIACPLDGQTITHFAVRPAEPSVLECLASILVRCPVCGEEVQKAALQLHLQDPVNMVESPEAYEAILKPFYMSCPLSNFTVGEFNGSSSLIKFYRQLGEQSLKRFVLTTPDFIVLPDPKMGFQPHTEDDGTALRKYGGYFNAYWVHPSFRSEVWWLRVALDATATLATPATEECSKASAAVVAPGAGHPAELAFRACREAIRKRDEATALLGGHDCSTEPWHQSSFMHTWSSIPKPNSPRYLCCMRDLRGEDVPMLETFRRDVLQFLAKNGYAPDEARVKIYCHYPASARFSTLHFHVVFQGEEGSRYEKFPSKLDRPHQLSRQFSLEEVIELLRHNPRHFETCTLSYFLGDKADLMDPISAFFGCSPHRHTEGFTFHWDPQAIKSEVGADVGRDRRPSAPTETAPRHDAAAESPCTFSDKQSSCQCSVTGERVNLLMEQVRDLRHVVDHIKQCLDRVGGAVESGREGAGGVNQSSQTEE